MIQKTKSMKRSKQEKHKDMQQEKETENHADKNLIKTQQL